MLATRSSGKDKASDKDSANYIQLTNAIRCLDPLHLAVWNWCSVWWRQHCVRNHHWKL